jgi:hypothetical protein
MTKKLVSELEGAELDYFVALAIGHQAKINEFGCEVIDWNKVGTKVNGYRFNPSTDWAQAGPLIDKYEIDIDHRAVENYPSGFDCGATCLGFVQYGHTALVAVCRSILLYKFGKYVDWPSNDDKELN